jgi:hypothetical protein
MERFKQININGQISRIEQGTKKSDINVKLKLKESK